MPGQLGAVVYMLLCFLIVLLTGCQQSDNSTSALIETPEALYLKTLAFFNEHCPRFGLHTCVFDTPYVPYREGNRM